MEQLHRVIGPIATNVHILADPRTREAIAIDTATPSLAWIAEELAARDWTLKLIVSHARALGSHRRQHGVAEHTGAEIGVHPSTGIDFGTQRRCTRRSRSCRPCRPSTWPRAARSGSGRSD